MNICIDYDFDELLWEMSKRDKKEMLEALLNDMNIKDVSEVVKSLTDKNLKALLGGAVLEPNTPTAENFNLAICNLINKSWRLTNEEEGVIMNIAERYS